MPPQVPAEATTSKPKGCHTGGISYRKTPQHTTYTAHLAGRRFHLSCAELCQAPRVAAAGRQQQGPRQCCCQLGAGAGLVGVGVQQRHQAQQGQQHWLLGRRQLLQLALNVDVCWGSRAMAVNEHSASRRRGREAAAAQDCAKSLAGVILARRSLSPRKRALSPGSMLPGSAHGSHPPGCRCTGWRPAFRGSPGRAAAGGAGQRGTEAPGLHTRRWRRRRSGRGWPSRSQRTGTFRFSVCCAPRAKHGQKLCTQCTQAAPNSAPATVGRSSPGGGRALASSASNAKSISSGSAPLVKSGGEAAMGTARGGQGASQRERLGANSNGRTPCS